MNLNLNLFLAGFLLLSVAPSRAELVRQTDGIRAWVLVEGRPTDAPLDLEDRAEALAELNLGQARIDAGSWWRALSALDDAIDLADDTEIGARARFLRAQAHAERSQFEPALDDLRWIISRRVDFPEREAALDLMLALARRLAEGERRWLSGWFPWFTDRTLGMRVLLEIEAAAPRGKRAAACLAEHARLAIELDEPEAALESLERLVGEHPTAPELPQSLARLADLQAKASQGEHWDQSSASEALFALEALIAQHPASPEAAAAPERIRVLREQVAASRLRLAEFYWIRRNNPTGARLMASAAVTVGPDTQIAVEALAMIARIDAGEEAPHTFADSVLGRYPRRVGANKLPEVAAADPGFRTDTPRTADGER